MKIIKKNNIPKNAPLYYGMTEFVLLPNTKIENMKHFTLNKYIDTIKYNKTIRPKKGYITKKT